MQAASSEVTIASGTGGDLFQKKAAFIQHSLPGLDPGRYQIQVSQRLDKSAADGGADISGGLPALTRKFGVSAPRFALAQNAIHSVYPPANSAGEFSNALPHVVLTREKLPWLRSPYSPGNAPATKVHAYQTSVDGKDRTIEYDDDQPTWLAVLLLSPSDLGGEDPGAKIVQGTVADIVPSGLSLMDTSGVIAGKLPANGYSVFSYLLEPQYAAQAAQPIDPGIGQQATGAVQYVDLPASLFNTLCPSLDDLKMMAHVRAVQMEHKPIAVDQSVNTEQRYALVIGNRLPESLPAAVTVGTAPPLGTNVALVVSLENMEFALRGHALGNQYDTAVSAVAGGFVRVVVLNQWRFTSWRNTSFEFETLLKSLNRRDPNSADDMVSVPDPFLRIAAPAAQLPTDDKGAIVRDMLDSGYLPFQHVSRLPLAQDNPAPITTVSWYRGPLIPFGAFVPSVEFLMGNGPLSSEPAFYSSDQLLRFDPNIGMYDVSLALAWQLGRLLALSDQNFATALGRWKKQVAGQYRAALERVALASGFPGMLLPRAASSQALTQAAGAELRTAVLRHLAVMRVR